MDRRSLLKSLAIPLLFPSSVLAMDSIKKPIPKIGKFVSISLTKEEGRKLFLENFIPPIEKFLKRNSFLRKILDTYPNNKVEYKFPDTYDSFPITSYISYSFNVDEFKKRRFAVTDRTQMRSAQEIWRQEDIQFLEIVDRIHSKSGLMTYKTELFSIAAIHNAMSHLMWGDGLMPDCIIVHPRTFQYLRAASEYFKETTSKKVLTEGLFGHFMNMKIYVSHRVPEKTMYIFAEPKDVGNYVVRKPLKTTIDKKTLVRVDLTSEPWKCIENSVDTLVFKTGESLDLNFRTENIAFQKVTYEKHEL